MIAGLAKNNGSLPPGDDLKSHLRAERQYTRISSGPNGRTFFTFLMNYYESFFYGPVAILGLMMCMCLLNRCLSNMDILLPHVYLMLILSILLTIFVPLDDGSLV